MNPILNTNIYFIKEHVGIFKAANNYDIFDPESNKLILECREEGLNLITKILRFTDFKTLTPFNIAIKTADGKTILTVKRSFSLFLSRVEVYNENNDHIGSFKQKFFSIGGRFDVLDPKDNYLCQLKGKWTSWEFSFTNENEEYALVTKKWAGLGKELFTSADNYVLQINNNVQENNPIRMLILAAVLCIDMVLKEK